MPQKKPTAFDMFGTPQDVSSVLSSVPQRPVNTAQTARLVNEGDQPIGDGMIDQSFRRPRGKVREVGGEGADMMYERTARENARTGTIMERLSEIIDDGNINPFTGKPIDPDALPKPGGRQAVQENYDDDDFIRPIHQPKPVSGNWAVVDLIATDKVTKVKLPVWGVQDEERGVEVPHTFRIQEAAIMACEYLNAGQRDKAKTMMEMDRRRFELAKQARVLKESKPTEYRKIMSEIAQINIKLGL